MNRLGGASLALVAASLFAGCPGKTDSPATTTPPSAAVAPKVPAPPPPVVGTVFAYHMFGGVAREDEVTAVGTATVTLVRRVAFDKKTTTETYEEPLDGPSPHATIKPDMRFEVVGQETLTISGVPFECEVREAKVGQNVLREWVAPRFPHLVRTRSGPFVTLELAEVRAPQESKK